MTKRRILLLAAILLIAVTTSYLVFFRNKVIAAELFQSVKKEKFEVLVVTSGELRSKSNTKISAPSGLQQVGIYQIKIADMVPEGTTVKAGEFVASLDNSDLMNRLNEQRISIDRKNSEMKQASLDTMLDLRALRDEIVNLKYDLRQKLLEKEQSKFEAPAEIKRVELDYERTERTLKQKEENFKTKQIQAQTKLQIMASDRAQLQNRMDNLTRLMGLLTIQAPKDGMVIYEKNWNGQKKTVGSQIELWNASVASLPDLSQMEVLTYINEVDIQKVKIGQKVDIGLDAVPDKKLDGIVKSIANIGEEKPGSDAKVFEVLIDIITKDPSLRPAMTTSCKILTERYESVLQLSLEAIYSDQKNSFVFKNQNGQIIKQEVKIHAVNETSALISNGLKEGDKVYLSLPADTSGLQFVKLDPNKQMAPKQLVTIDTLLTSKLKKQSASESKSGGGGDGGVIIIEEDE